MTATIDRELLAFAAKAAGKTRGEWDYDWLRELGHEIARDMLWNPLTNNGDAMWLAVKLPGMDLQYMISEAWLVHDDHDARCAYVRRAITISAADFGRAMP